MSKFDAEGVKRLERMYASPAIVEQRARTRAALGLRPGERGLDIGCGPGFLLCEMAEQADTRLSGIDASEDMVAAARRRIDGKNLSKKIDVAVGDATHLDFPAASFEFVTAVQVYLYVENIERALAEAARVLKPGGRLVIVDTDWDSCVWLTSDRERNARMIEGWARQFAQPHLPPLLPKLIQAAGLRLESVESFPVLNLRYEPDAFSAGIIELLPGWVSRLGLDPAEAQAWAADLRGRTAEGEYFFSVNRYLFRARRDA
jgi:ubiquinone/menaquinone biosynthesis C-methylase UbiE